MEPCPDVVTPPQPGWSGETQEILKIESQIFFAMCFVSRPETDGSVGSIRYLSSDTQKGAKFYLS